MYCVKGTVNFILIVAVYCNDKDFSVWGEISGKRGNQNNLTY